MGVHGVGSQTSLPATNATVSDAVRVARARSCAVKLAPAEWLDTMLTMLTTLTTLGSEICAGPGHVPPDPSLPPPQHNE